MLADGRAVGAIRRIVPAGQVGVVERVVRTLGQEHRARRVAGEELAPRGVGCPSAPSGMNQMQSRA